MNTNKAIKSVLNCYKSGNLEEAKHLCKEILKKAPQNPEVLYFLGIICAELKERDLAIQYIKNSLQFNTTNADAYIALGNISLQKNEIDKSITYYQEALRLNPTVAHTYNLSNIYIDTGNSLSEKGDFDNAILCYREGLNLNPTDAIAYNNLGIAYQMKSQINEAIINYQKAIKIDLNFAEAHFHLSHANLLSGNFEEGWKEYDWRLKTKDMGFQHSFSQPPWTGFDIKNATILIYVDQGMGDAIQFSRYIPFVAQRGAKVLIGCQKELISLLQRVEGVNQIIGYPQPLPDFDVYCPLSSLPVIFNTTLDTIPQNIPYIPNDFDLSNKWKEKLKRDISKLKIGLTWAGNPKNTKIRYKSFSLDTLSPLANFYDITFYSLQKEEAAKEAKNPPMGMKLFDYTEELNNFSDTAALIENLDLVISVDTAVAHLTGALGKPIWILLPFAPDWRWMLNRDDSPWYPTMRLFRQPSFGDWETVIESIKNELLKIVVKN